MTEHFADEIFKALSLRLDNLSESEEEEVIANQVHINNMAFNAEFLKCIPEFDGNPTELHRFISTSDSIINNFYDRANPASFMNTFILNSIINRLSGTAKLVANIQNVSTWQELKTTLYSHFADQRDEACLNRDLIMLKQIQNETPQQFHDKCLQLLNTICSYIDIHEQTVEARTLKREFYLTLTLRTFLSGLREPLGTTIRSMKPSNLNEALQFIVQEENAHRLRNYSHPVNSTKPKFNHFNNQNRYNSFNQRGQNYIPQNFSYRPNSTPFPSQPIDIRPRPIHNQKFFTNKQVFGSSRSNVNTNRNAFAPKRNYQQQYEPTPMSISTRQTYRPNYQNNNQQSNFNQQSSYQRPTFISEELFNAETKKSENVKAQQNFRMNPGPSSSK